MRAESAERIIAELLRVMKCAEALTQEAQLMEDERALETLAPLCRMLATAVPRIGSILIKEVENG